MNQLRIVSVCSCVGERGLGVNEGLERAMLARENDYLFAEGHYEVAAANAASAWFRSKFNDHIPDADAVEFRFPAGRVNNGGILPRRQCAKWQKIEGPVWQGFSQFLLVLIDDGVRTVDRVQVALPFPTKRSHIAQIRDLFDPEDVALRFEDLGSLAPQFMKRIQPLLDAGYRVGADTVPTDNIGQPGLATRFDLPRGYERVTWGVRSRIVRKWIERGNTPGNVNPCPFDHVRYDADGINLSLLLTGDADDVMPVADLERVRPLLSEIRCQNVKDENMRTWIRNQRSGQ